MRVLSIPGWHGSGSTHWQTIWEARYAGFERVEQRDWMRPNCQEWVATLDWYVRQSSEPTLLVAHSLGCLAVAHWAASREEGQSLPIGALLVSPPVFHEERLCPEEIKGFVPIPEADLPFPSILVASRSDIYVSFEEGRTLAESWGAQFRDAGYAGHINTESGHGEWPEGERLLLELMDWAGKRKGA